MSSLISNNGKEFPRDLTPLERMLIFSQLPEHSDIYRQYRERIGRMKVVGIGKRGAGHLVLCEHKVNADALQLVTPVFAVGGAEQNHAGMTIVIHEIEEDTVSVELMALNGNIEVFDIRNARLWSISNWDVGQECPKCSAKVREIKLPLLKSGHEATLAVCPKHRAIWVNDGDLKMNHIIPVTGFLSELDKQKSLRKGKYEYHSAAQIFSALESFSDLEFMHAFILYNKFCRKLEVRDIELEPVAKSSFASKLVSKFIPKNSIRRGKD